MRQCHQRTMRPSKGDPADFGRDQSGARAISHGSHQGIRRLWSITSIIISATWNAFPSRQPTFNSYAFRHSWEHTYI